MKLIGSTTSPFVRKVRLLLEGQDYEFETLKALSPEGVKKLESYGPVRRIPILIDGEKVIFDSSLISEYLLAKKSIVLSLDEKLTLKLIDELCDAGIILFQQKLWEIDPLWENEFSKRTDARANAILDQLEQYAANDSFTQLQKDWLFCVLDWINLRQVFDWTLRSNLLSLYKKLEQSDKYTSTRPE